MNSKLGSFLAVLCLVSLAATTMDAHAMVKHKTKQGFGFIDFGKLGKNFTKFEPFKEFGRVEFESKGKKKPDAEFIIGLPAPSPSGQHEVSVELVALSLTSVNQVPLGPFPGSVPGETGDLALSLLRPALNPKSPAIIKKEPGNNQKGKGKLDIKLDKKFKVSTKKNDDKKELVIPTKKLKALGVGFTYPFDDGIVITDPSFCLENGSYANICLAPIVNPIPIPGALALMAPALSILFLGHIIRRRRPQGGGSSLAASNG